MNIQDWLSQLLSRPAADPLDWESYRVTMDDATWKALIRAFQLENVPLRAVAKPSFGRIAASIAR